MREIKFRVWDEYYRYMNYKVIVGMWGEESLNDENYTACSMYIIPDKVDYKCKPHWANFEPYMEDIHLMQYTGMKDKNGTEIYEADIVWCESEGEYFAVDWNEYSGRFTLEGQGISTDFDSFYSHELEVVGNRYENPELLGE